MEKGKRGIQEFLPDEMGIQQLIAELKRMQLIHEAGETCFDQSETWKVREYGWHNPLFPPEYRRCCLNGKVFRTNAASDLYYMTACYYEKITGCRAPCNFELDNSWEICLTEASAQWSRAHQKAVIGMIRNCTRWQNRKRMKNAGELLKTVFAEIKD